MLCGSNAAGGIISVARLAPACVLHFGQVAGSVVAVAAMDALRGVHADAHPSGSGVAARPLFDVAPAIVEGLVDADAAGDVARGFALARVVLEVDWVEAARADAVDLAVAVPSEG